MGFALDHDTETEHMHVAQLTPPGSGCSIGRGVEVSEIQVFDERGGGTFFGFADPDGNTWSVQQIKARGETPLIPLDARGRFGEGVDL